jgi:hypothetical protein
MERVGVEDDFFDLGGDSVLSMQVVSRLRAAVDPGLSARAVFDARTVAGIAALLPERPDLRCDEPIAPVDRSASPLTLPLTLPLSPAQERLWFLDNFTPDSIEYYTGVGLTLSGELDTDALRTALDALVARHESLRTTFSAVDGRAVQTVHPHGALPLRREDLSALPAPERDRALDEALRAEAARPFDLASGPLIRALLVRRSGAEHVLVLSQHHIVTDGWSIRLLVDELAGHYAAARSGEVNDLPDLPVQYPDYALWHRDRVSSPAVQDQLGYWQRQLADLTPLDLPTDRPRPPVRRSAGAVHRRELPGELVSRLVALGRAHGVTPFTVLTAAVQVLLSRYSGQRDIALGTVTSGRNRTELEDLAGFFVNTLVLRSDVDPGQPFGAFLAGVGETVLEAFAHDEVPFDQLVEVLAPVRDPSRTPLIQVVAVLQNSMVRPRTVAGLRIAEHDLPRLSARFDLIVEFWPCGDSLSAVSSTAPSCRTRPRSSAWPAPGGAAGGGGGGTGAPGRRVSLLDEPDAAARGGVGVGRGGVERGGGGGATARGSVPVRARVVRGDVLADVHSCSEPRRPQRRATDGG